MCKGVSSGAGDRWRRSCLYLPASNPRAIEKARAAWSKANDRLIKLQAKHATIIRRVVEAKRRMTVAEREKLDDLQGEIEAARVELAKVDVDPEDW